MKPKIILIGLFLLILGDSRAQLIQGTIKTGVADSIEIWIRPDFTNSTQYLFQLGFPIAVPATVNPASLNVSLDPGFIATFGNNYSVTVNPLVNNTGSTEKYFNIVLIRKGVGASNPQNWTAGTEVKVFSALFTPPGSPSAQVKLVNYHDGGSDGQGNFYTMDGNANYYVGSNSIDNFYASSGQSITGGNSSEGFAQTIGSVPCTIPVVQPISGTNRIETGQTTQLNNITPGGIWTSDAPAIATVDATGLVTGVTPGITTIHFTVANGCGVTDVTIPVYIEQRLIAGTIKKGTAANEIEIWLKPYFSNNSQYLFQLGFPVAFPVSADLQLSAQDITLDSAFKANFGDNYSITVNPVAQNTPGTEKYYNVVLIRKGTGASAAQTWESHTEFRVFTASFSSMSASVLMKLADYQDGGNDGQGNFYSMDGNANYYVVSNSVSNFYEVPNQSAIGGNASAGYAQLIPLVTPACPQPTGLSIGTIGSTSAENISWNPSSGALGYEISVVRQNEPISSVTPEPTVTTTHTETGLLPGTSYNIYVRANCAPGVFSDWSSISFITLCPSITTLPVISGITMTSAGISWSAVTGVTGYQYLVSTDSIPTGTWISISGTSFSASGLMAGTVYYVFVRSSCSTGVYSAWSRQSFTTAYPACNPTFIPPVDSISDTARINWTELSSAVGYEFSISKNSTPPSTGTFTEDNNYLARDLQSATQYYAHVRVVCGPGRYSSWYTRPFITPCFKLKPFIVENTHAPGIVDLGWYKIPGALKYEYAVLNHLVSPGGSLSFTNDTILHLTGLAPGMRYYLHVRTQCAPGNSSEWSILEFHTSGINVYPNPANGMITVTIYGVGVDNGDINLLDAAGKLLKKIKATGNRTLINMESYAGGLYFIQYDRYKKYIIRLFKQ